MAWSDYTTLNFPCGCNLEVRIEYGANGNEPYPQVPHVILDELCDEHVSQVREIESA